MPHIKPPIEPDYEALDKKLDEMLEQEIWGIKRIPKDLMHREHLERWAKTHSGTDLWAIVNFLSDLEVWTRKDTYRYKGNGDVVSGTSSTATEEEMLELPTYTPGTLTHAIQGQDEENEIIRKVCYGTKVKTSRLQRFIHWIRNV